MFRSIKTRLASRQRSHHVCQLSVLAMLVLGASIGHAQSSGLTLDAALQLSLQNSVLTKAAEASVQASSELVVKADQLPDPMLKMGIGNLPTSGPNRLSTTRDSMTTRWVGLEQQWISADKRAARSTRAQLAVDVEKAGYLTNIVRVREETAVAWVNALYAQRTLSLFNALEKEASQDLLAARAAYRGAKIAGTDITQAQLTLSQVQDRTRRGEQVVASTRIALSRWTAVPVESLAESMPPFIFHVPDFSPEELEKIYPTLLTARRAVSLADSETTVATRDRQPNWSFEASFSQRGSQYSNLVSVGVNIPLRIHPSERQDRDIAEKSALATKARMQYVDALRELQAEIQEQSSTLVSLNQRISQLKTHLLPPANQQVELAIAAYRSGTSSLGSVFNAKKIVVETQLQVLDVEKEAALTWAKLEYRAIPHDFAASGRTVQ